MKKNNKGFTLVELIVVLVILAILAAILTPALLGYIDRAKAEKDYSTAQTIRVAAQAMVDEKYGSDLSQKIENFSGTIVKTDEYGAKVCGLAGVDPSVIEEFTFNYTEGIIKSGNVKINGSTYYLWTDGTWHTTQESGSSVSGNGGSTSGNG